MHAPRKAYSVVPALLGAGLLALLLAAALSPNTGLVAASSNCAPYNTCPSSSPAFPWWIVAVVVLIVAAALIAALLLMRRRRPPRAAIQGWQEAAPAPAPGAAPPPGATAPPTGAAYIETPEDVGHAPPDATTVAAGAAGAAAAAPAAAAAEGEPDIDSLMAELDKISGEILKRAPKKPADEENADGSGESGSQ